MADGQHHQRVTEDQLLQYQRDGVSCVRNLLSPNQLARLRSDIDNCLFEDQRARAKTSGNRQVVNGFCLWMKHEGLRELACASHLPDLAAAFMRSSRVNLFCDHLFVKEPDTPNVPTPWHNDQPYWGLQGDQVISFWIALDSVTLESGAVEFVRGSHKWKFPEVSGETFEPTLGIDENRNLYSFVHYELAPGDMTVHHGMTVHGARGNSTASARRRGYVIRYAGDDVRYRPHKAFSVPGSHVIAPGHVLAPPPFPIVFQGDADAAP